MTWAEVAAPECGPRRPAVLSLTSGKVSGSIMLALTSMTSIKEAQPIMAAGRHPPLPADETLPPDAFCATRIELRQLRYFVSLAEELHFGRAAAREHIVQSALSQQVQRLERTLGVLLVRRTTRHIELTAGRRPVPHRGPPDPRTRRPCRRPRPGADLGATEPAGRPRSTRATRRSGRSCARSRPAIPSSRSTRCRSACRADPDARRRPARRGHRAYRRARTGDRLAAVPARPRSACWCPPDHRFARLPAVPVAALAGEPCC